MYRHTSMVHRCCRRCVRVCELPIYFQVKKTCNRVSSTEPACCWDDHFMVLCEMYHARQSPRPVLIKSLQKSSFIGQISQYFPAREVCDWSVLTKLSLCMGLVPALAQIPYIGDVLKIIKLFAQNLRRHFFVRKRERGITRHCVLLMHVFGCYKLALAVRDNARLHHDFLL